MTDIMASGVAFDGARIDVCLGAIPRVAMLAFVIAHVYMATMGKTIFSLIKPMLTGYETPEVREPAEKPRSR